MILKAVGYRAGVGARIDLKTVCDAVLIENIVKFAGIDAQAVLVADVH